VPATLYATTGLLDGAPDACGRLGVTGTDALSWDVLPDLAGAAIEIGSHTESHPELDTIPIACAHREVVQSKHRLEDTSGAPVRTFAYPHGYSSRRMRALVRSAGYASACAVREAFTVPTTDRYALARLVVRSGTTSDHVASWLRGSGAPIAPAYEPARTRLWRAYRRADATLHSGRRVQWR